MTARSEALRQPKPLHAGAWLLVASVLVAAALVMAFVLTRSGSTPTTSTKPPVEVSIVSTDTTTFQDAGPTGRLCAQWGECGAAVGAGADPFGANSQAGVQGQPIFVGGKLCHQCA